MGPPAKAFFQEVRGSAALQASTGDNGNTICQDLSLVHVVGRKYDDLVFLNFLDDVPRLTPRSWVHTRSRFIKKHKLLVANEGHEKLKFTLLAT